MIGRNGLRAWRRCESAQKRPEHASRRGDLAAVLVPRVGQGVEVPEQLVCAVDQVDFHGFSQVYFAGASGPAEWDRILSVRSHVSTLMGQVVTGRAVRRRP